MRAPARGAKPAARGGSVSAESKLVAAAQDAVEVLAQLGHSKPAARDMIERVLSREDLPDDPTPEVLVERALR